VPTDPDSRLAADEPGKRQVSAVDGDEPVCAPSGRELFYRTAAPAS
jgi:hypothetical protein